MLRSKVGRALSDCEYPVKRHRTCPAAFGRVSLVCTERVVRFGEHGGGACTFGQANDRLGDEGVFLRATGRTARSPSTALSPRGPRGLAAGLLRAVADLTGTRPLSFRERVIAIAARSPACPPRLRRRVHESGGADAKWRSCERRGSRGRSGPRPHLGGAAAGAGDFAPAGAPRRNEACTNEYADRAENRLTSG
jgi:hypothetical protein